MELSTPASNPTPALKPTATKVSNPKMELSTPALKPTATKVSKPKMELSTPALKPTAAKVSKLKMELSTPALKPTATKVSKPKMELSTPASNPTATKVSTRANMSKQSTATPPVQPMEIKLEPSPVPISSPLVQNLTVWNQVTRATVRSITEKLCQKEPVVIVKKLTITENSDNAKSEASTRAMGGGVMSTSESEIENSQDAKSGASSTRASRSGVSRKKIMSTSESEIENSQDAKSGASSTRARRSGLWTNQVIITSDSEGAAESCTDDAKLFFSKDPKAKKQTFSQPKTKKNTEEKVKVKREEESSGEEWLPETPENPRKSSRGLKRKKQSSGAEVAESEPKSSAQGVKSREEGKKIKRPRKSFADEWGTTESSESSDVHSTTGAEPEEEWSDTEKPALVVKLPFKRKSTKMKDTCEDVPLKSGRPRIEVGEPFIRKKAPKNLTPDELKRFTSKENQRYYRHKIRKGPLGEK